MIIESINYGKRLKYTMGGYRKGIWLMVMKDA
jgi:hypothetical protein